MVYPVKFGFPSGRKLVFTAYQPDGSGRGIEQQPLVELREGYYAANPTTDLEAGDEAIAYLLEDLYWEDEPVYVLTEPYLYYEQERVFYEDQWVIDYDSTINDIVTSLGTVVGAVEYNVSAEDFFSIIEDIETLIQGQQRTYESVDETGLTAEGVPRQVADTGIGYVKTEMLEV